MLSIARIGSIGAALGACIFALALASANAAEQNTYVGQWWGSTDWDGAQYDSDGVVWNFQSNGTFSDNTGQTGTWTATSTGISFRYDEGARSMYTGNVVGNTVLGTMTNGEIRGQFFLVRSNQQ